MSLPPVRRRKTLVAALSLLAVGTLAIGLGPKDWWLCDLFANLRLLVAALLSVLLPMQLLQRQRGLLSTSAVVLVASLLTVLPGAEIGPGTDTWLRVESFNLGRKFRGDAGVLEGLRASAADVLVLQEYGLQWHEYLQPLHEHYPHAVLEPRPGSFGIALFSKRPLPDATVQEFPGTRVPFIRAPLTLDGRRVDLVGVHLQWPMTPQSFAARNRQIEYVSSAIRSTGAATLVCGDWNLTPWSRWFNVLAEAGLHGPAGRSALSPTWPASLGWFGIPIDHCLATAGLTVMSKTRGRPRGSDHRPIVVKIGVTDEPVSAE